MSRRAARCTEAYLKRAVKAAVAAGAHAYVEVLPDGTIRIAQAEKIEQPRKQEKEINL